MNTPVTTLITYNLNYFCRIAESKSIHIFRVFDNEQNAIKLLNLFPDVQYFFPPAHLSKHHQIKFVEKDLIMVFFAPQTFQGLKSSDSSPRLL